MPEPVRVFPLDTPVPDTMQDALRALQNGSFLTSQKDQTQQWRADRVGGHATVIEFERLFVKRCRALAIPMHAHNMVRTNAQQEKLLKDGVTRSPPGHSPHNFGCAVDIIHGVRGWDLKANEWALLGHIGKELAKAKGFRLTWGGDWNFYDPAHWELADWRQVAPEFPLWGRK